MIEFTLIGVALIVAGMMLAPQHVAWLVLVLLGIAWLSYPTIAGWLGGLRAGRAIDERFNRLVRDGFSPNLVLKGNFAIEPTCAAFDFGAGKIAWLHPDGLVVLPLGALRSVMIDEARALGQSNPSWYALTFRFNDEAGKRGESYSLASRRRRRVARWIETLRPRLPTAVEIVA